MEPEPDSPDVGAMTAYSRAFHGKLHIQRALVAACGVILTVLVFVQVVTRYLFNISIFGIEELATYVAVWFYMLGAAIGAHERGHISASLVDMVVKSERGQGMVKAFTALVGVVICAWMTVWGAKFAAWSFQFGMNSVELGFPMGWVHAAIPVGLGLMTLYFFIEFIEDARFVATGHRP